MIVVVGAVFFGLDWITWKKSENYKGKRASLAALIVAPVMCVLSLCAAIIVYLGTKKTMKSIGCEDYCGKFTLLWSYREDRPFLFLTDKSCAVFIYRCQPCHLHWRRLRGRFRPYLCHLWHLGVRSIPPPPRKWRQGNCTCTKLRRWIH